MELQDTIYDFYDEIVDNKIITAIETKTGFNKKGAVLDEFPENLKTFYKLTNTYKIFWETKEPIANGQKILGKINIIPSEQVLRDWKGVVYFDKYDHPSYLEKFKIVDFFADEVCVGYYQDESKADLMYYYTFEDDPVSLDVNFAGYLELLFMARGFLDWPGILLHLKGEEIDKELLDNFKTYMPKLFPGFSWDGFVELYEKVKIK